jgi:hypothetical protein
MRSIYLQSSMLITLIVLEICPGQSSKCKNKQRAIIQKLGKTELRFLYTAHLLNEIYLPTKFYVETFCCFKVMSRTRKAGGQTDGQGGDYMLPQISSESMKTEPATFSILPLCVLRRVSFFFFVTFCLLISFT